MKNPTRLLWTCLLWTACQPPSGPPADAASADAAPADLASVDQGAGAKRVFLTSGFYKGDLKSVTGAASGIAGADQLCNQLAQAAGLGGTFRAWLSTGRESAFDRITGDGPWVNMMGSLLFADHAALRGAAAAGLTFTERRSPLTETYARTGTLADGSAAPDRCADWEATTANGAPLAATAGSIYGGAAWTQTLSPITCATPQPFYCFEL